MGKLKEYNQMQIDDQSREEQRNNLFKGFFNKFNKSFNAHELINIKNKLENIGNESSRFKRTSNTDTRRRNLGKVNINE